MTKPPSPEYEGPKYTVHDFPENEANFFIRIEEGKFKGVEFCYLTIENKGLDDDDKYHITPEFAILSVPPHLTKVERKRVAALRKEFEEVMFNIFTVILYETVQAMSKEVVEVEEVFADELDTTVPDEFHPDEFYVPQQPESD